jgi:hypothetical protein
MLLHRPSWIVYIIILVVIIIVAIITLIVSINNKCLVKRMSNVELIGVCMSGTDIWAFMAVMFNIT